MIRKIIVLVIVLLAGSFSVIWAQTSGGSTIAQGENLADKMEWLKVFAQSGGSYIVEVRADENVNRQTLEYSGKSNITITLRGVGANRTLNLSAYGAMFTIGSGVTLVLENNITLKGRSDNNNRLIRVEGGELIMNNGSTITGNGRTGGMNVTNGGTFTMNGGTISSNTSIGVGGGVYVHEGTFTMNGGTISGNTSGGGIGGGGVFVNERCTFAMNGGTISGNIAPNGGGVCVDGTFMISGGTISGNIAREYGGGVFVGRDGTFAKTSGAIIGYGSDKVNGNAVKEANGTVRNFRGHVAYVNLGNNTMKLREATAGLGDNLSYSKDAIDGAWDN
jgi:hypothetical protein